MQRWHCFSSYTEMTLKSVHMLNPTSPTRSLTWPSWKPLAVRAGGAASPRLPGMCSSNSDWYTRAVIDSIRTCIIRIPCTVRCSLYQSRIIYVLFQYSLHSIMRLTHWWVGGPGWIPDVGTCSGVRPQNRSVGFFFYNKTPQNRFELYHRDISLKLPLVSALCSLKYM